MRRFLPIIAALLLAASCNLKVDEEFLVSPDICLQENGKMILKYESTDASGYPVFSTPATIWSHLVRSPRAWDRR